MSFFKPICSRPSLHGSPALAGFLAPFATAALTEKASLWRTLEMLRTASLFLLFEDDNVAFIRRGFLRYACLHPVIGTPPGDLLWHLLGYPKSVDAHDRAMRNLAVHLAWYQTTRFRTDTPAEVIQVIDEDAQTLSPGLIYEIVKDEFSGMLRKGDFGYMFRRFQFSIANPDYIRSWGTQRKAR